MKKIKIFMMMLLAVLSFAACSDDDDPNENVISEYTHNDQIVSAQKAKSGKNEAVLLVAFGSTWTNAFAAFDETKKAYEQAFPNADVYFCFSSHVPRRKTKGRDSLQTSFSTIRTLSSRMPRTTVTP